MAFVSKAIGAHPKGLKAPFSDPLRVHSWTKQTAYCGSSLSLENCLLNNGSKSHVWANEKIINLHEDQILLRRPVAGIVHDWYGGPCSTAAMQRGLVFILIKTILSTFGWLLNDCKLWLFSSSFRMKHQNHQIISGQCVGSASMHL